MKTISITRFGDAGALAPIDKPIPAPGPDEVTIDVIAAGVNFAEILYRKGIAPHVPLPFTPGIEVAGTVRAVGAQVTHLKIGQRVAALTVIDSGGYAEVVSARAALTRPVPDELPWKIAAGTPSNATTALMVVQEIAGVRPGERVAIHAAAGGVGTILGQVAKLTGAADIVGTVGSRGKIAYASRFGFTQVQTVDDFMAAGSNGFDVIIDPVGGPLRQASLAMLRPGGRLVAMGNAGGAEDVPVSTQELWLSSKAVLGFNLHLMSKTAPAVIGRALQNALEHVARGRIEIDVTDVFPLAEAARAHRLIEERQSRGKLVLQVT